MATTNWTAPAGTAQGTYGEGNVQAAYEALQNLKSQVQSGKLNLTDYYSQADPIVKRATQWVQQIAGGGSKAARAVNPIWSNIQNDSFVANESGQWITKLPFSRTEYAKLPDSVLPTQEDVNKGLFDPSAAPFSRYRAPTPTPTAPPALSPGQGTLTPGNAPRQVVPVTSPAISPAVPVQPVPVPSAPTNIPVMPPPTAPPIQNPVFGIPGQNQNIPSLANSPDLTIPFVPQIPTNLPPTIDLSSDRGQIEQEAARQTQQSADVLSQQNAIRQSNLKQLMPILQQQAASQFNYDLPGIKEQLQGSGVLNSDSALGNAIARESANLLAPQLSLLQQYGISSNDAFASGLGDILGQQQANQQGGLQRDFSLADFQKQANLASQIGASTVPQAPGASDYWKQLGLAALGGGAQIGAAKAGGTFFCSHLKKLGLMTEEELQLVHKKIFPVSFSHYYSLFFYWLLAPIFIKKVSSINFPWIELKKKLCDEVLVCETSEQAFQHYKSVCIQAMKPIFPLAISFFFGFRKIGAYYAQCSKLFI